MAIEKPTTPVEVVTALIERYTRSDYEAAVELYDDSVIIDILFALPRPVTQRRSDLVAMLEQMKGRPEIPRMYQDIVVEDLRIHETTEPGTVIAEWNYRTRVGDDEVVNPNIIVCGVVDGRIVWARDYHDHITRAVANGVLPTLLAALDDRVLPRDRGGAIDATGDIGDVGVATRS